MLYDVDVDGSVSGGKPSGSVLASISSKPGFHTITLTSKPSTQDSSGLLVFEGATVTVGTGLTGYFVIPYLPEPLC
jgi:hypothetical protein